MSKFIILQIFAFALLLIFPGCVVDSKCYSIADCANGEVCNGATGKCHPRVNECKADGDCAAGFECVDGQCRALSPLYCPTNMVSINNSFCIDKYEASKPDATSKLQGNDTSKALTLPGVKPWEVANNAAAQEACEASGKTLCNEKQWQTACAGPDETLYAYGDEYESATCNGIDAFCLCDDCVEGESCSYPHCYNDCGASFKKMPTGSFPNCTNAYGVFDMNGNLWEHVLGGSEKTVRGGAFNCKDSKTLHECTYVPGWVPSALGFRCCSAGSLQPLASDSDTHMESQP